MASPIQILSSPCSMVQRDLDAKQKFMENLTLTQKVPANVLLMNPYETFKSYFDKNQKQYLRLVKLSSCSLVNFLKLSWICSSISVN